MLRFLYIRNVSLQLLSEHWSFRYSARTRSVECFHCQDLLKASWSSCKVCCTVYQSDQFSKENPIRVAEFYWILDFKLENQHLQLPKLERIGLSIRNFLLIWQNSSWDEFFLRNFFNVQLYINIAYFYIIRVLWPLKQDFEQIKK